MLSVINLQNNYCYQPPRRTCPTPTSDKPSSSTTSTNSFSPINVVVGGRYRILCEIAAGSFGKVFLGHDSDVGEDVAIKLEDCEAYYRQLKHESQVYQVLQGCPGFPGVRWYGKDDSGRWAVLVMELLGPSLEDLFRMCSKRFTTKTVAILADQMISRLEVLHSRNLTHRDLKPENFVMGLGHNCAKVHLIDFGLSKKYRNRRLVHIAQSTKTKVFVGTASFVSVNVHRGQEQSRRDDMEALGYILVYFCRGSLPWQGLVGETAEETLEKLKEKKMSISVEELTQGLPLELTAYLRHVRELGFDEMPDYDYLRRLFRRLLAKLQLANDQVFDWSVSDRNSKGDHWEEGKVTKADVDSSTSTEIHGASKDLKCGCSIV